VSGLPSQSRRYPVQPFRPQASGTLQSNPRGQYASHDRDNSRPGSQGPLATKVWCRSSIRTTYERSPLPLVS